MPPARKVDELGLYHRKFWPTIPAEVQEHMRIFLAWYRAEAEYARERSRELLAVASEDYGTANVVAYWEHALGVIDWLTHRVGVRQKYLEIEQAMKEGRWTGQATKPDT